MQRRRARRASAQARDKDEYFPYVHWKDAELRLLEGERRWRLYHRVWTTPRCRDTGMTIKDMEGFRLALAESAHGRALLAAKQEKETADAVQHKRVRSRKRHQEGAQSVR